MVASSARYTRLKAELDKLKELADRQTAAFKSSTEMLYEGLSRVYIWWQEASKEKGLLDKLYNEYGIQYKKDTDLKINFSPLLRYVWNMDIASNGPTIHQWSKALNKVDVAVKLNSDYYKQDTLHRLIEFIKGSGGIQQLAGYVYVADSEETRKKHKRSKSAEEKQRSSHIAQGEEYYANSASPITTLKLNEPLPTATNGLVLGLLRKNSGNYELLSAIDDKALVDEAVITAYKRSSDHMPNTARLLVEVIRTQALPNQIANQAPKLTDKVKWEVAEGKKETRKQLRRLLYVAKSGSFVLSSNRSACSVVTVAHPRANIFDSKEDLALAVGDRTYIEDELIHSGDFAFFVADAAKLVPATKDEAASHKLRLENKVTNEYRYVRFYKLSAFQPPSRTQAVLKTGVAVKPKYSVKLDRKWIERMNALFLSQWLGDKAVGKKMARDEYSLLGIAFAKTMLTISHTHQAGEFKEHERIDYEDKTIGSGIASATVLGKDIIPVLNALVQMEIEGDIEVQADEKMIGFVFATASADYKIAVPCCTAKGKRIGDYFEAYGA